MSSLADASRLKMSADVYARPFGDELVLLHFGRGDYFGLDAVGTVVWNACMSGKSLGTAAQSVVEQFDVDYTTALRDIIALVDELRRSDLVIVEQ